MTARALSRAGDAVYPIGLTAALLHAGYGPSAVGFVVASATGPVVLLMLVGGALLDRVHPRAPMVVADFARCFLQGGIALLFLGGRPPLGSVIALSLGAGVAQAFFQPGVAGMLKRLAGDRLQEANATVRTAESFVGLTAPALGGLAVAVSGASTVIAFDALSYAVSGCLLLCIRMAPATHADSNRQVWRDLAAGWQEFTSRPWLWPVITTFTVLGLVTFGPFDILKSVVLIDRLGTLGYGLMLSAYSLGMIFGGLLALWTKPDRPLHTGAMVLTGLAPLPAVIALGLPPAVIACAMVVGGAAYSFWAVLWATAVQSHSPVHAMGRIAAYDIVGSTALIPVGRALSGPAVVWLGASTVLMGSSVALLLGCTVLLGVPAVAGLRRVRPGAAAPSLPAADAADLDQRSRRQ